MTDIKLTKDDFVINDDQRKDVYVRIFSDSGEHSQKIMNQILSNQDDHGKLQLVREYLKSHHYLDGGELAYFHAGLVDILGSD